jgi:outer membrane lipoprotein
MRCTIPTAYGLLLASLLLAGCAAHIPPEIKQSLPDAPTVEQVRADPSGYLSRRVRWGGMILETENRETATWLTILALPLSKDGKPRVADESPGRFIAIVPLFLEPMVYSRERLVTVTATVLRSETRKVGEFPYLYPVIEAEAHHLWPVEPVLTEVDRYPWWWYDPWYFDPWYYPYYPYYRHPRRWRR